MSTEETLLDQAKNLDEAYDDLIRTLYCERDRWKEIAGVLAARGDEEEAKRLLAAQAAYIREQAIR